MYRIAPCAIYYKLVYTYGVSECSIWAPLQWPKINHFWYFEDWPYKGSTRGYLPLPSYKIYRIAPCAIYYKMVYTYGVSECSIWAPLQWTKIIHFRSFEEWPYKGSARGYLPLPSYKMYRIAPCAIYYKFVYTYGVSECSIWAPLQWPKIIHFRSFEDWPYKGSARCYLPLPSYKIYRIAPSAIYYKLVYTYGVSECSIWAPIQWPKIIHFWYFEDWPYKGSTRGYLPLPDYKIYRIAPCAIYYKMV
jgi:hypothetical protein